MKHGSEPGAHGEDQKLRAHSDPAGVRRRQVTLIPGEGTGVDMFAMQRVLDAAGADIAWEIAEAGERVRAKGIASGLPWETIDSIQRTRLAVRGPLTRPLSGLGSTDRLLHQGFDVDSQALRVRSLPGVWTSFGKRDFDFWLVRSSMRELEQDPEPDRGGHVWPSSVPAGPLDERMFRRAFELARQRDSRTVRCAVRTNRHGLLRVQRTFLSVATDYPEILAECVDQHLLAQDLVAAPEQLGILVTSNAVGDMVMELASRVAGGLSFLASLELGDGIAMFAPGHAAVPSGDGEGRTSPVGAIRAGVLLLEHVHQTEVAQRVERGLAATLQQGVGTEDIARTRRVVSTSGFADAVISNLSVQSGPPSVSAPRLSVRLRGPRAPGHAPEP